MQADLPNGVTYEDDGGVDLVSRDFVLLLRPAGTIHVYYNIIHSYDSSAAYDLWPVGVGGWVV